MLHIKYISKYNGFDGDYRQRFKEIDKEKIRVFFEIPDEVKNDILYKIPDIRERVVIHVRRGDYLNADAFISPSKEYIIKTYKKYYDNEKVVIISDGMQWCKENLNYLTDDIIFSDGDTLFDFYLLTLSKANICSASSFSVFGSYLNKNEDCVIPYPYYNTSIKGREKELEDMGENIIPIWAKRENIII